MKSFLAFSLVCSFAVMNGTGCSSSNIGAVAATAKDADLPVCTSAPVPSVSSANPPNGTDLTPDKYKLSDGASNEDQLFLAILKDDDKAVAAAIAEGVNPNEKKAPTWSVGSDGTVKFAKPSQAPTTDTSTTVEETSALAWAAERSTSGSTIKALLQAGADPSFKNSEGESVLMLAARNENLDISGFQALADSGLDLKARSNGGEDTMASIFSSDNTSQQSLCSAMQKVQILKQKGVDINASAPSGTLIAGATPIMLAIENRNLGLAKLAKAMGADTRMRLPKTGGTLLHLDAVAADDNVAMVRWLLNRGVDPRVADSNHQTAIQIFQQNLKAGTCHAHQYHGSVRDPVNLCQDGTQKIITLLHQRMGR